MTDFLSYSTLHGSTDTFTNQQITYGDWFGSTSQSNTTPQSQESVASASTPIATQSAVAIKRRVGRPTKAKAAARKEFMEEEAKRLRLN